MILAAIAVGALWALLIVRWFRKRGTARARLLAREQNTPLGHLLAPAPGSAVWVEETPGLFSHDWVSPTTGSPAGALLAGARSAWLGLRCEPADCDGFAERVSGDTCTGPEDCFFPCPEEMGIDPEAFPGGPGGRGNCGCGTPYDGRYDQEP